MDKIKNSQWALAGLPSLFLQQQPMTSIPPSDSNRAFTIIFNSDEQNCILGRMRKMRLITDSTTKELSQHHVQLLNTMFASKEKGLDCFNKNLEKQDSGSVLQQAAMHCEIIVENEFEVEGELAEVQVIANTNAWDNLADTTEQRHLKEAAGYMREQALPFLHKSIHPMDDYCAPLSNNFLMSEVLRYRVRDAREKNLISPTL